MPILTYMGRIISSSNGSFLANKSEPKIQKAPPIINAFGAPIMLAKPPTSKLPKRAIPFVASKYQSMRYSVPQKKDDNFYGAMLERSVPTLLHSQDEFYGISLPQSHVCYSHLR